MRLFSRGFTFILTPLLAMAFLTACPQTPAGELLPQNGEALPLRASKMEVFNNGDLTETYTFEFDDLGNVQSSTVNDEGFLTRSLEDANTTLTRNLKTGRERKLITNAQGHVINEKLYGPDGQLESEHQISYDYFEQKDGQNLVLQKTEATIDASGNRQESMTTYTYLHENGPVKLESAITKDLSGGVNPQKEVTTTFEYSPLGHLQQVTSTSGYLMKIDVDPAAKTKTFLVDGGNDGEVDSVATVSYEPGLCQKVPSVYQPEQPVPSECSETF